MSPGRCPCAIGQIVTSDRSAPFQCPYPSNGRAQPRSLPNRASCRERIESPLPVPGRTGDHVNTAPARYTLAVLIVTAFTSPALGAFSPDDGATLQTALAGKALVQGALVPRGFARVAKAKGDLDGDGTDDLALIVRRTGKKRRAKGAADDDDDVPQAVLIFTGDKSGKFTLWKLGISHFMDSSANLMEEGRRRDLPDQEGRPDDRLRRVDVDGRVELRRLHRQVAKWAGGPAAHRSHGQRHRSQMRLRNDERHQLPDRHHHLQGRPDAGRR